MPCRKDVGDLTYENKQTWPTTVTDNTNTFTLAALILLSLRSTPNGGDFLLTLCLSSHLTTYLIGTEVVRHNCRSVM